MPGLGAWPTRPPQRRGHFPVGSVSQRTGPSTPWPPQLHPALGGRAGGAPPGRGRHWGSEQECRRGSPAGPHPGLRGPLRPTPGCGPSRARSLGAERHWGRARPPRAERGRGEGCAPGGAPRPHTSAGWAGGSRSIFPGLPRAVRGPGPSAPRTPASDSPRGQSCAAWARPSPGASGSFWVTGHTPGTPHRRAGPRPEGLPRHAPALLPSASPAHWGAAGLGNPVHTGDTAPARSVASSQAVAWRGLYFARSEEERAGSRAGTLSCSSWGPAVLACHAACHAATASGLGFLASRASPAGTRLPEPDGSTGASRWGLRGAGRTGPPAPLQGAIARRSDR